MKKRDQIAFLEMTENYPGDTHLLETSIPMSVG